MSDAITGGRYTEFADLRGYEVQLGHHGAAFQIKIGSVMATLDGTAQLCLWSWLGWHIATTTGRIADLPYPDVDGTVNDGGAISEALASGIDAAIADSGI